MSNLGRWDRYYKNWSREKTHAFGCETTYRKGYEFLAGCERIEDWGCGYGFFRNFCAPDQYRGLDCSCTPHADENVDFVTHQTTVPGIFMRHVLEHNPEWKKVLSNALASFQERMVLILFTPLVAETVQILWDEACGNPTYSFSLQEILDVMKSFCESQGMTIVTELHVPTRTMFKEEHLFYLEKLHV
jgi:hypothetical protein